MKDHKVVKIIDGDTFDVEPKWNWGAKNGTRIRPAGFDAPELGSRGGLQAKRRLAKILMGQTITLRSPYRIDRGRLVCEVFYKGRNLKDYFN